MRKGLFKKVTAVCMSLTMIVGMTGVAFGAHAANGSNVAKGIKWESFSVCTAEDAEEAHAQGKKSWREELEGIRSDDWPNGQVYGVDFATEGFIAKGATDSNFDFFVKSTGWDAEYNPYTNEIAGDNPWGLTATIENIPVEYGRYYTISFKIKSTLKATLDVKDEAGNVIKDENGQPKKEVINSKHILFKAYDQKSPGEPSLDFVSASGATNGGYITVIDGEDYKTVTATVKVPEGKAGYGGNVMGIKLAMGAFLKTYPKENNLSGYVYIRDFKVTAGTQYTVKLTNGKQSVYKYVNKGSRVPNVSLGKKGYTLTGFKNKATGANYNFNTPVNSNLELVATYVKTKKPAKPKVTVKTGRKKASVSIKKVKGATGYEIQYSAKKNMKKAKKKTTTKAKYTIKKLKSGSIVYVKVRAYTKDSAGNKVFGKLSKRRSAYIK